HPAYTPLDIVDDEAIQRVGIKRFADAAGSRSFLAAEHAATSDRIVGQEPSSDA
ncbi:MAG: hypothetical protein GTO03_02355, partial [Planctomycetales bacterium]|nr:hypothetical protein [Planctomycetales bacterium]